MTLPTHLLAGLIIGHVTGEYTAAIVGSTVMDLDHFYSYFRSGALSDRKSFLKTFTAVEDPDGDQRNILHNVFVWGLISIVFIAINPRVGLIFSISYFIHLLLDAIDTSAYFPFYPLKRIIIKGFVKFYSYQELILNSIFIFAFIYYYLL